MSANLSHGGVAVTMTPAGSFQAVVGGVTLTAPSFASIKKKIEKAGAFEPFEAFHVEGWRSEVQRFTVTGIRKAGNGRSVPHGTRFTYVTREGNTVDTRAFVYKATPENLAIAEQLCALKKANSAAYDAGKNAERKLEAQLVGSKADYDMSPPVTVAEGSK